MTKDIEQLELADILAWVELKRSKGNNPELEQALLGLVDVQSIKQEAVRAYFEQVLRAFLDAPEKSRLAHFFEALVDKGLPLSPEQERLEQQLRNTSIQDSYLGSCLFTPDYYYSLAFELEFQSLLQDAPPIELDADVDVLDWGFERFNNSTVIQRFECKQSINSILNEVYQSPLIPTYYDKEWHEKGLKLRSEKKPDFSTVRYRQD